MRTKDKAVPQRALLQPIPNAPLHTKVVWFVEDALRGRTIARPRLVRGYDIRWEEEADHLY